MTILSLNGLEVECILGDLPHERCTPQRITLDATLEVTGVADATDMLKDTVDYAALSAEMSAALTGAKCRLLERAARIAAEVCIAGANVGRATVTVTKHGAVPGLKSASATFSVSR